METENKTVLTPGNIALAATPIGNPLDASFRLVAALREADLIAAEDTRRVKRLASELGIRLTARTLAYHEHNEVERTETLLNAARSGQKVLLVTDAGMPVVSDPGFRAVDAATREGIAVDVFPGPSAPLTALVHSGIAPDRFAFEGFLPRTSSKRLSALESLSHEARTLIFFESPRRTREGLEAMVDVFGAEREACVARELTKTHEEIMRGTLAELAAWARGTEVLGEIAIVVAPAPPREEDPADLAALVLARAEAGERLKDAAKAVAREHERVSARELYDAALAHKNRG